VRIRHAPRPWDPRCGRHSNGPADRAGATGHERQNGLALRGWADVIVGPRDAAIATDVAAPTVAVGDLAIGILRARSDRNIAAALRRNAREGHPSPATPRDHKP
jgi:hypothetical protein